MFKDKVINQVFSKKVVKPYSLDFPWNNPTIMSYVIVIVQVLTKKYKSKFTTEDQQVYMI